LGFNINRSGLRPRIVSLPYLDMHKRYHKPFKRSRNLLQNLDPRSLGQAARLAIPINEHYLPLLYILPLQEKNEQVKFFADRVTLGSLSMRSLWIQ
jgi:aromatic ring-opening dioxygenase catalytic subunit (LigB family)